MKNPFQNRYYFKHAREGRHITELNITVEWHF